jgi:hypothetical protein
MQNQILRFFAYEHLPQYLQNLSKPFGDLAELIETNLPDSPEKTVAFRKLLEAKDCAVRAAIPAPTEECSYELPTT